MLAYSIDIALTFSETSQMPNARFQAAGAIGDAAIREWGILTDENKRSLISYAYQLLQVWLNAFLIFGRYLTYLYCRFCVCYVMDHSGAADGYVQSKVSAVAALLIKRGW